MTAPTTPDDEIPPWTHRAIEYGIFQDCRDKGLGVAFRAKRMDLAAAESEAQKLREREPGYPVNILKRPVTYGAWEALPTMPWDANDPKEPS